MFAATPRRHFPDIDCGLRKGNGRRHSDLRWEPEMVGRAELQHMILLAGTGRLRKKSKRAGKQAVVVNRHALRAMMEHHTHTSCVRLQAEVMVAVKGDQQRCKCRSSRRQSR